MEQKLEEILVRKNEMVLKGQIVEATEKYFAKEARTIDFDSTITQNKTEMVDKMQKFAGAIQVVNTIKLHHVAIEGQVTFAEFTFDFDMKDGSHIHWHEIIRSVWKEGKIIEEQYFKS